MAGPGSRLKFQLLSSFWRVRNFGRKIRCVRSTQEAHLCACDEMRCRGILEFRKVSRKHFQFAARKSHSRVNSWYSLASPRVCWRKLGSVESPRWKVATKHVHLLWLSARSRSDRQQCASTWESTTYPSRRLSRREHRDAANERTRDGAFAGLPRECYSVLTCTHPSIPAHSPQAKSRSYSHTTRRAGDAR